MYGLLFLLLTAGAAHADSCRPLPPKCTPPKIAVKDPRELLQHRTDPAYFGTCVQTGVMCVGANGKTYTLPPLKAP